MTGESPDSYFVVVRKARLDHRQSSATSLVPEQSKLGVNYKAQAGTREDAIQGKLLARGYLIPGTSRQLDSAGGFHSPHRDFLRHTAKRFKVDIGGKSTAP